MKKLLVLLALLLVVGCAPGDSPFSLKLPITPMPDTVATQVALAQAVEGTMTALAPTTTPTPTHTLVSTITQTPLLTAMSTNAAGRKPTATSTNTEIPTSTATPIVIPEGWQQYTHSSQGFSLYLPPDWYVVDAAPRRRHINIYCTASKRITTEAVPWLCEGNDKQMLRCLIEAAKDRFSSDDSWTNFQLVDARVTSFGKREGYVIDHDIETGSDLWIVPWHFHIMQVWLPFEKGRALHLETMYYDELPPGMTLPDTTIRIEQLSPDEQMLLFEALGTLTYSND